MISSSGMPSAGAPERVRCPRCSALAAAGAQWCGQCLHDLREPEPQLPPEPVAEPSPFTAQPVAAATIDTAGAEPVAPETSTTVPAGGGRHRRTAASPSSAEVAASLANAPADDPAALAQRTLEALLAVDPAAAGMRSSGAWARRMEQPGSRMAIMLGGSTAVSLVVYGLFVVAGNLLG